LKIANNNTHMQQTINFMFDYGADEFTATIETLPILENVLKYDNTLQPDIQFPL